MVASTEKEITLLILTIIREVMSEKPMVPENEQANFNGEDEIKTPADFVTLGE